jgi:hypothetical protein
MYEPLTKQMGVKTTRTLFYAEIVAYITTRNQQREDITLLTGLY